MSFKSFQCIPFRCSRSDHGELWYWWVTFTHNLSKNFSRSGMTESLGCPATSETNETDGTRDLTFEDGSEFASWRSRSANVLSVFVESVISCFSLSLLVGPILVGGYVCGQKLLRNPFSWQKLMSKHLASLQKMMRDHDHQLEELQRNLQLMKFTIFPEPPPWIRSFQSRLLEFINSEYCSNWRLNISISHSPWLQLGALEWFVIGLNSLDARLSVYQSQRLCVWS